MKYVILRGEIHKRNVVKDGEGCPYCKVVSGSPHHTDCDHDMCPKCGTQVIQGCDCVIEWRVRYAPG